MPEGSQNRGLTLVLGGARSGKSRFAEGLVTERLAPWTYVATGQAFDAEMAARIAEHRGRRAAEWETVDAPHELSEALAALPEGRPVLVDCLTLWLSNRLLAGADIDGEADALAALLAMPRGPWVVVSNEVGFGIVPDNALGRRFRDAQGRLNQAVAAVADRVELVVAGLPVRIK